MIKNKFPEKAQNILPIIFVDSIDENSYITNTFYKLKLHNSHRKYNQYEAMSRYATQINKKMEVGTVGVIGDGSGKLPNDRWGRYLRANMVNVNGHYSDVNKNSPIANLRFPLSWYRTISCGRGIGAQFDFVNRKFGRPDFPKYRLF